MKTTHQTKNIPEEISPKDKKQQIMKTQDTNQLQTTQNKHMH